MHKLYIFMRSDLESLNAGKAMAQAAHAANQFWTNCTRTHAMQAWANEGGSFGTTIVLDAAEYSDNLNEIGLFLDSGFDPYVDCFGVVYDPTYPIKDGKKTHLIPLNTCAYYFDFGQLRGKEKEFLNSFQLYP